MLIAKTSCDDATIAILDENPDLVNFRDYDRRTPLHVASSEGNIMIAKLLVERGARRNRSDRWGGSALDDALRHNHKDMVTYLRSIGARCGVRSNLGELIAAAAAGDEVEVRALLDDGTSPNGCDYDKRTPVNNRASTPPPLTPLFKIPAVFDTATIHANAAPPGGRRGTQDHRRPPARTRSQSQQH